MSDFSPILVLQIKICIKPDRHGKILGNFLLLRNLKSYICNSVAELSEDFALRVPPFHFCGTVRLTLTVPLISELWYRYRASEMNAVKRCSVTDAP